MNVSVLVRLVSTDRTGGRLAGQAELIETGETLVFASDDDLLAFLRRVSAAEDGAADSQFADPTSGVERIALPLNRLSDVRDAPIS